MVGTLLLVGHHAAAHLARGTLALQQQVGAGARHPVVQGHGEVVHVAVGLLGYIAVAHQGVAGVGLLQLIEVEACALAHICLHHLCGEKLPVVGGVVAEEQAHLGAVFHHDEHTAVGHEVNVGAKDVDYLYGALHLHAGGHIHQQSVLCQHGVQGDDAVVGGVGQPCVVFTDEFGSLQGLLAERAHHHSLGQCALGQQLVVEAVVYHEIERGAQVGHIASEGVVGIDGYVEAVQVQTIVFLGEEGAHVGILVALHLAGGESVLPEMVEGFGAGFVEHRGGVRVDYAAALLEELYVLLFAIHESLPLSSRSPVAVSPWPVQDRRSSRCVPGRARAPHRGVSFRAGGRSG